MKSSPLNVKHYTKEPIPLGGYITLMSVYGLTLIGLTALDRKRNAAPAEIKPLPLLMAAMGSYKFARIVTMSFIGSPIRAPFAKRGESLAGGEVQDEARGEGLQKAIGSLLTCPFCFNVWSATGFFFGMRFFPRLTQNLSHILATAALGDVLHLGYRNVRETVED